MARFLYYKRRQKNKKKKYCAPNRLGIMEEHYSQCVRRATPVDGGVLPSSCRYMQSGLGQGWFFMKLAQYLVVPSEPLSTRPSSVTLLTPWMARRASAGDTYVTYADADGPCAVNNTRNYILVSFNTFIINHSF